MRTQTTIIKYKQLNENNNSIKMKSMTPHISCYMHFLNVDLLTAAPV